MRPELNYNRDKGALGFRMVPLAGAFRTSWDAFIQSRSDANVFHTSSWIDTILASYGGEAHLVLAYNHDDIVGGFPIVCIRSKLLGSAYISLPYSDHCKPLFDEPSDSDLAIKSLGCSIPLQIRWPLPEMAANTAHDVGYIHFTDLTHLDATRSAFNKTRVLQPLRKAETNRDLRVDKRNDLEAARQFYVLSLETSRRLKALGRPWSYFQSLHDSVLQRGSGFILLVKYRDRTIAGGVFLHAASTITYKHSASLPDFWDVAPNHLLLWRAMQIAATMKCSIFDWGRTNAQHQSLRVFKAAWAAEERKLTYVNINFSQPIWPWRFRRIMCAAQPHLPLMFTQKLSAVLAREFL